MSWTITAIILVAILGIITSYTDFKERKIKNKHIAFFLVLFFAFYIARMFLDSSVHVENYTKTYLYNFGLTAIFSIFLWVRNAIPPGDAKLFMVYAAGIPIELYPQFAPAYFPFVFVMFLAFAIPGIMNLLDGIFSLTKPKIKKILLDKNLSVGIIIFNLYIIISEILSIYGIHINIFYIFVFFFVIKYIFNKLWTPNITWRKWAITTTILGIISVYFISQSYIIYFIELMIFPLLFGTIPILSEMTPNLKKSISINKLKEGMTLSGMYYLEQNKVKKSKTLKEIHGKKLIGVKAEGITEEEIKLIKDSGINKIGISIEIPLAPLILLAIVITTGISLV